MTLTEQWKKGELEKGYCYIKLPTGRMEIVSHDSYKYIENEEIKRNLEVLAPVPSYDRFCRLNHLENDFIKAHERINELEKENQQLKELLKECKPYVIRNVIFTTVNKVEVVDLEKNELLTKIDNAIGEKK